MQEKVKGIVLGTLYLAVVIALILVVVIKNLNNIIETNKFSVVLVVTVEMPEGKLLVLYKIYQKHNLNSYYVVDTLLSATDMQTDCIEFILGLYRPYTVKITVA